MSNPKTAAHMIGIKRIGHAIISDYGPAVAVLCSAFVLMDWLLRS